MEQWQCVFEAVNRYSDYEKGLVSAAEMVHLIALAQTSLANALNGIATDMMKADERKSNA